MLNGLSGMFADVQRQVVVVFAGRHNGEQLFKVSPPTVGQVARIFGVHFGDDQVVAFAAQCFDQEASGRFGQDVAF
jgi:hypothetical protein